MQAKPKGDFENAQMTTLRNILTTAMRQLCTQFEMQLVSENA